MIPLVALVLYAGCVENTPSPPPDGGTDAAYQRLSSLQFAIIDTAASNLSKLDFTRTVETVAYSDAGDTVAFEHIVIRHAGGTLAVVDSARRGDFRQGFLARIVAPEVDVVSDTTNFQAIVPQDPPYLSGRWRDAYAYALVDEQGAPAVEVRRRSDDEGEGADLEHALFIYAPESNQVIGMRVTRQTSSALGDWMSMARLDLEPLNDSLWVPRNYIYSQSRAAPLQRPYRFSRRVVYSDYSPR